jgi:uncharacterized protein YndB with AHSA1/START domain
MLTADHPKERANLVVDTAALCIRLERQLAAPPDKVFEAWTTPEQVACWWDPSGERLAVCEIDLQPGGAFKFVPSANPDMPFAGVYREIDPPRGLTFEAMGAIGRVLLDENGNATRLRVEIQCLSLEHLQQFLRVGVGEGTSRTLDNLVAYVAAQVFR